MMTIERAADIIQEACIRLGVPMTRDLARDIARLLRDMPKPQTRYYEPGEIARHFRDRYEQDQKQE